VLVPPGVAGVAEDRGEREMRMKRRLEMWSVPSEEREGEERERETCGMVERNFSCGSGIGWSFLSNCVQFNEAITVGTRSLSGTRREQEGMKKRRTGRQSKTAALTTIDL
jgi:hypothetical protein